MVNFSFKRTGSRNNINSNPNDCPDFSALLEFDCCVWHWWHLRVFPHSLQNTKMTFLVSVLAPCTAAQYVHVRGEPHQHYDDGSREKQMNICKVMLAEVLNGSVKQH